jgi:hypothetical protein
MTRLFGEIGCKESLYDRGHGSSPGVALWASANKWGIPSEPLKDFAWPFPACNRHVVCCVNEGLFNSIELTAITMPVTLIITHQDLLPKIVGNFR